MHLGLCVSQHAWKGDIFTPESLHCLFSYTHDELIRSLFHALGKKKLNKKTPTLSVRQKPTLVQIYRSQ